MTAKQKTFFWVAILLMLAGVEMILCLYREHFLLLYKNSIFIYSWDFLHQHIAIPAWEEWKWTGVFQTGGLARYADAFFAQFYKHGWAVEAVQIPLVALWAFIWCKILNTPKFSITSIVVAVIAAVFWLYITISATVPFGMASGALLNAAALLLFVKAKPAVGMITAAVATPLLYFFTGVPAVLIFFLGAVVTAITRIIARPRRCMPQAVTVAILFIVAFTPYFAAKPLLLQSRAAACNADFFKQFRQKSTDNLYHINERIEYALYKDDYAKALKLCDKAYKKIKAPKTQRQVYSLWELAYHTKMALLFNGELCSRFLQYYNLPAMQWLFPINISNKIMADLFFRLGESGYAKHAAIDEMEVNGLSTYTEMILNSKPVKNGLQTAVDAQSPPDMVLLELPTDTINARRDAKAMIYLLFKQLDSAVVQFDGTESIILPRYIQEALLIRHRYGQNPAAMQELRRYALSDEIVRKYEQFLQALQAYQYRQTTQQLVASHFEGTYAYYYFFQTAEYQR
jgi:hypothetical protein